MKYVRQFVIIMLFTFLGEVLKALLPFPVPASIYGLLALLIALETKLLPLASVRDVGEFFVEIMPKNVHKATSLEKLLKYLDMDVKDLIACGDGFNDLTMIDYAGVGVAMGNAQQIVKDHADYITLTNDEDGLVPVIEKFILNL